MSENPTSRADFELALTKALEQLTLHSAQMTEHARLLTEYVMALSARVSGTESVAAVVDENESQVVSDRTVAAQKDLISFMYEKSQQYVTVVVAGAYAAYFTTLSTVSARLSDDELRVSALLMTVSLALFVFWEIFNVAFLAQRTFRGMIDLEWPTWYRKIWPIVLGASILTALPSIGLSTNVYVSGLVSKPAPAQPVKRPPPNAHKAPVAGL